jgi:hypothetical protein
LTEQAERGEHTQTKATETPAAATL